MARDVRRLYNDNDISSVFKIADNEELRKAVMEKNIHSILRLVNASEDLRKAIIEKIYTVFLELQTQMLICEKQYWNKTFTVWHDYCPKFADEFKLLHDDQMHYGVC